MHTGKISGDKEKKWVAVVLAEDVEKFLNEYKVEPVGDSAEKLLRELVEAVDTGDSGDIVGIADRAAKILGIPDP
jgi:broad-specificity NMP kinase